MALAEESRLRPGALESPDLSLRPCQAAVKPRGCASLRVLADLPGAFPDPRSREILYRDPIPGKKSTGFVAPEDGSHKSHLLQAQESNKLSRLRNKLTRQNLRKKNFLQQ